MLFRGVEAEQDPVRVRRTEQPTESCCYDRRMSRTQTVQMTDHLVQVRPGRDEHGERIEPRQRLGGGILAKGKVRLPSGSYTTPRTVPPSSGKSRWAVKGNTDSYQLRMRARSVTVTFTWCTP